MINGHALAGEQQLRIVLVNPNVLWSPSSHDDVFQLQILTTHSSSLSTHKI